MTVKELLYTIDRNGTSTSEIIQIVRPDGEWWEYDEACVSSALIKPIYDKEIKALSAIEEDVIRVSLDWESDNE